MYAPPVMRPTLYCSFCERSQHEVEKLFKGPFDANICNLCVWLCLDILLNRPNPEPS